jgi:TonB-dependent SusC/RagA subfamily outer membrane receptor
MQPIGRSSLRRATAFTGTLVMAATLAACRSSAPSSGPRPGDEPSPAAMGGTGSVLTLQGKDLTREPVTRIEQLIEGRAPGVEVRHLSGGGFALVIRGVSTINGSSEPLVVVDGVMIPQGDGAGALAAINPGDVARIDVLKDAGSTAFYGSRGANGVILVTTKHGGE